MIAHIAALLAHLSPLGLGLGFGGLVILVGAVLALHLLPSFVVRPIILVGAVMLATGAVYQVAFARATHASQLRQADLARDVEAQRAAAAETITRQIAEQASRDLADLSARNKQLQDLTDALQTSPSRDRVCVDRDLARRLREL